MAAESASTPGKHLSSMRVVRWLTWLGLGVAAGMLLLGAALLFDLRQEAWRRAEQSSTNLVLALERDIERNLTIYDLSVQGTIDVLHKPGIDGVAPDIRHSALFDRAATAEYLASLLVLDAHGDVVDDSTALTPHKLYLGDRDYFIAHQQNPDAGLFISKPFRSRLRNGDESMSISRRIPAADGGFEGVVVGSMRLAYFQTLFERLDLGRHGTVTLAREDGQVIVRQPPAPSATDGHLDEMEPVHRLAAAPSGHFVMTSEVDGVRRYYTYRRIGHLPLMVTVALGVNDIFADWRRKAASIGSILLVLSAATIALCLLFRREMQRRVAAESALLASAERLSVMAATDGLTGLANRRAFEAELVQEWKRAVRAHTPVALLLLDADWFKPFNDLYGHQEGDDVLRKIAGCIQRLIRRPADLGARYGGEEFVVLLPDTDLQGAAAAAALICDGVAALGIKHDGSALGRVTISVGVASVRPQPGDDESQLVRRADQALYEAKRSGRGRVVLDQGAAEPTYRAARAPNLLRTNPAALQAD